MQSNPQSNPVFWNGFQIQVQSTKKECNQDFAILQSQSYRCLPGIDLWGRPRNGLGIGPGVALLPVRTAGRQAEKTKPQNQRTIDKMYDWPVKLIAGRRRGILHTGGIPDCRAAEQPAERARVAESE